MVETADKIKCLAVIRGSSQKVVRVAVLDLNRHAHLIITGAPRECDPAFADNVLVQVMDEPLKKRCKTAAVVALVDEPSIVIARLLKIHPPAHIVIVTPDHSIFNGVMNEMDMMPEFDVTLPNKKEKE